ncbi:hypothetical protein IEQ34_013522 [Dendrobium chrysotoxum]|uniref:Uncharacterized protein n=1 Tax=Dendrobium chrysotoxum TaxID=161865 RepID=A0AAV7GRL9_DENCH|nr:hypothetical protein IEQ34_013522 [Dendrobium chrysotoxum]
MFTPSLDIGVESSVIPIYVSFPNLRSHLFSPRILHALGSMFVDSATFVGSRLFLAWVLVELDITKNYLDKIWVGPENVGYVQMVQMEEFLSFCVSCKGECNIQSSAPSHVPKSNANPDLSDGNANGNAIVVLASVVNEEQNVGGFKKNIVNDLGVSVAGTDDQQISDGNAFSIINNIEKVHLLMPISLITNVVTDAGGVNEVFYNIVGNDVNDSGGLNEGNCNIMRNVVNDPNVNNEGVMLNPNPCMVNLVSTPVPSSIVGDVDDVVAEYNVVVDCSSASLKLASREVAVCDYFFPLETGDRVVVPPMAELMNVNSGEVGNALDTLACFNASFSDGSDPMAKTLRMFIY